MWKGISPNYNSVVTKINQFDAQGLDQAAIEANYDQFIDGSIAEQRKIIDDLERSNYIQKTQEEFVAFHQERLTEISDYIQNRIVELNPAYLLKPASTAALNDLFYQMINVEWIFEVFSGLVFFGFGDDEMYPATCQALVGSTICDITRIRPMSDTKIIPGQLNSNIIPYAQADVTETVLTGVDPKYIQTMQTSIESSFNDVAVGIAPLLADQTQEKAVTDFINNVGQELIQKLNEFQFSAITGPLLEILAHMGKEDMAELAESLVNITSIKRKFTSSDSSDESVGGPVDVAIVTKGDGFIWIKRKHYFDIQNNTGFTEKYLKF